MAILSLPSQHVASSGESDGVLALHRVLFPVGPRQEPLLRQLQSAGSSADVPGARRHPDDATFLAFHRGVAHALEAVVRRSGARSAVADWVLAKDEGVASELLWGGSAADPVIQESMRAFLRAADEPSDIGESYCTAVAPDLRHRLGEHYTPHWLVRGMVHEVPVGETVADPACGDGRFLVALLNDGHDPEDIWGVDLNPLAVVMARLNVWLALGRPASVPPTQVRWADFVLGQDDARVPPPLSEAAGGLAGTPPASVYLGNPPWITWRNMSDRYREAVAARMAGSRLNHARGWAARVSAGQADLAHVFVHEAIERVRPHGRIAFILPRTTFKAPVGPARLREGVSTSGRRYRFAQVWDCVDSDPFTGVRTDAVVGFVDVDQPNVFPVRWQQVDQNRVTEAGTSWASPSDPDDPSSPWLTVGGPDAGSPLGLNGGERWIGLRARGGVNTGGGNGVFHVEMLRERGDVVTIRNLPSRRYPLDVVTADVERDYIRPLLRGRDVGPWRAEPSARIVVPHDPRDLRKPVVESDLAASAPLTHSYLSAFKEFLSARKELHRWQPGAWYALFRIGPYTAGCWRVVWPHSANGQLRAAVLPPGDRTVPDQKVVLVPFDSQEPALFMCAVLNCEAVRQAAARSGGMDASPNLVRRLVLPRFDPESPPHREIVEFAAQAAGGVVPAQRAADDAASELFLT